MKKSLPPGQLALKKQMQMEKLKNKISMVRNITRSKVYTSMEGEKLPLDLDEEHGFTKIRIKRNNLMPSNTVSKGKNSSIDETQFTSELIVASVKGKGR